MQRIQANAPPAPPTRTEEEILADLERNQEELGRVQALKAADAKRKALLKAAKVLVPASPSSRKKRARQEEHFNSGPPPPRPAFGGYDSTTAGPPSYTHADTFAPPPKKQSEFASHESVLRPSKFGEGLHNMAKQTKSNAERRTTVSSRKTGFNNHSVASHSVGAQASSSKSGSAQDKTDRAFEKKRTSARSSATLLAQSLARETAAAKPSMSRQSHAPKAAPERAASKRISNVEEVEEGDDSDGLDVVDGPKGPRSRRKDGTVIERVEQGPIDHPPIPGDPLFETIEPNSGIRLRPKSRLITHEELQSHLSDRYHLSPSLLYSFSRPSGPSGSLEVDLVGDFIVIAVLAWKDEVRFKNPNALKAEVKVEKVRKRWEGVKGAEEEGAEEEEEEEEEEESVWKKETKKQKTSRYIRFTLVDLSTEAAAASGTGTLNLLLFEAESQDTVIEESGYEVPRYKGGSGGAYEKFWKEPAGSVLAILNPRVLKSQPKPGRPNVLTITPESADSMMVIGRARDLSSCQALRANSSVCGDWCDARVNKFCEWHVSRAVKGTGAGRAETYSANSSLNNTTAFSSKKFAQAFKPGSRKPTFDPLTKTGLLPRTNVSVLEGSKTYVVPGSGSNVSRGVATSAAGLRAAAIQSGNGAGGFIHGVRDGPTVERAKRDVREAKVAKARRLEEARELVERDKGTSLGGRYVELADRKRREVERERVRKEGGVVVEEKRKGEKSESEEEEGREKKRRRTFTNAAVRLIGYDPTTRGAAERDEDEETKKSRLDAISSLSFNTDRPTPKLRAPPGVKVRSGVVAPREEEDRRGAKKVVVEEDDDDDDLVVEGGPAERGGGPKVVLPAQKEVVQESS